MDKPKKVKNTKRSKANQAKKGKLTVEELALVTGAGGYDASDRPV